MKDIYLSVRALLYPKEAQGHAGSKGLHPLRLHHPAVYRALTAFELQLRGSRDLLNTPISYWGSVLPDLNRKHVCSEVLSHHALNLVRVFSVCYQLPQVDENLTAALNAVLDAQDITGRVQKAVQKEINDFTKVVLKGLSGDYSAMVELESQEDGSVVYKLEAYCPHLNEMAQRVVKLPVSRCSSLREAHAFLFHNQVMLQELLETLPSWPEFQPTAEHLLRERVSEKLKGLLSGLTREEQEFLLKNWSQLRPTNNQK